MTRSDALAIELVLDRLDARADQVVCEYLRGRWRDRSRSAVAPLPAMFAESTTRATLAAWRRRDDVLGRRAEMLWRWYARAVIETHPDVLAAFRARDMAGLIRERNRLAGPGGYYALALALEPVPPAPANSTPIGPVAGTVPELATTVEVRDAPGAAVGRTFPVAPGDVRVAVSGPAGHRRDRVLAHELGHAAYAAGIDPSLPFSLRRPPSRCLDEAVAMRFEATVGEPGRVSDEAVAAERAAYDSEPPIVAWNDQWATDPVALPSYQAAAALANRLAPVPLAELPTRVFWPGARTTVSNLLADGGIPD